MTGRVLAALPLLLVVAGCVNEPRSQLVNSSGYVQTSMTPPRLPTQSVPVNEATARRVLLVAQRLVDANQQAGVRPVFLTFGLPHPEIFHRGGGIQPWHVHVSSGLVQSCATDAQLAAVLAMELGKIVAEREALASPAVRRGETRLPPIDSVGADSDGTRLMEQARFQSRRPPPGKAPPLPSPEALARGYLTRAGYPTMALTEVAPLLRQAEDHYSMEQQMRATDEGQSSIAEIGRPIVAGPAKR
jgi:hypothetical protein